jgi:hypothetical protein
VYNNEDLSNTTVCTITKTDQVWAFPILNYDSSLQRRPFALVQEKLVESISNQTKPNLHQTPIKGRAADLKNSGGENPRKTSSNFPLGADREVG